MSITPIITFKAGICDVDQSEKPYKVKAYSKQGYIYLYLEEDLIHFCWRPRDLPMDEPELDLVMVPTDGHFVPYDTKNPSQPTSKTNARIFSLKFSSSPTRHLFWLQSKPQGRSGDPSWFSPRDLKIGEIVDSLLQGEDVDVNLELASVRNNDSRNDGDDDETMEDVEGHGDPSEHHQGGTGGAGADATGGDVRTEGEDAREGGADGARAASNDAAAIVQNFLNSLKGGLGLGAGRQPQQRRGKLYPLLNDLLETSTTIPMLDAATDEYVDNLLNFLPPTVLVLAQQGDGAVEIEPSAVSVAAAREAMSSNQKRALLKKVLRSPQFSQSLASLTTALRDGGLPSIAEALGISVENGGIVRGGTMPLGGGDAVEAFVEGVKKTVQKK
ncbi:proteasome complex subunit Rpn13 ubiquitin receptor-domain-containing protein [Bombardia bombarda]|uniref:Proteasome complex subunit Rpn13 ubiquitin receptor-domain-containing protein n=1 Tax=Bombardia bombarda TaxID=252184 RepID=A0AA39WZT7_9PEZI|nr:proteasome complex subunit Rpn13 ubiquitin receptor-domain-containing protein [Bombardia bombarda]